MLVELHLFESRSQGTFHVMIGKFLEFPLCLRGMKVTLIGGCTSCKVSSKAANLQFQSVNGQHLALSKLIVITL